MLDIDHRRRIVRARVLVAVMAGITSSGFWTGGSIQAVTAVALIANLVVWSMWWLSLGSALRTLRLAEDQRLYADEPAEENTMKS